MEAVPEDFDRACCIAAHPDDLEYGIASGLWPELGEPSPPVQAVYVGPSDAPTHHVDVTDSIDAGVASLQEHRAYLAGLGTGFDPEAFLRGNTSEASREFGLAAAVRFARLAI